MWTFWLWWGSASVLAIAVLLRDYQLKAARSCIEDLKFQLRLMADDRDFYKRQVYSKPFVAEKSKERILKFIESTTSDTTNKKVN